MPIYASVVDTVGRTPLIRLSRYGKDLGATILGKIESRNPCGSVKDRVGVALIRDAETRGLIKPGDTIVEATSGNTGIALAFAAAALGYKIIITMPESMSRERIGLLRLLGAEVELTRGGLMRDAVQRAEEIARGTKNAVRLDQFSSAANPLAHSATTAVEILEDTGGELNAFVAGVGTGGTITGCGRVLKEHDSAIRVVAVEPSESAVLSGKPPGPHTIQGIGAGFVPAILDRSVIDEVVTVSERSAVEHARRLAREEGLLVGLSSGAAVYAAHKLAKRTEMKGKTIVVILCDTGERYLSTSLVEDLMR